MQMMVNACLHTHLRIIDVVVLKHLRLRRVLHDTRVDRQSSLILSAERAKRADVEQCTPWQTIVNHQ